MSRNVTAALDVVLLQLVLGRAAQYFNWKTVLRKEWEPGVSVFNKWAVG